MKFLKGSESSSNDLNAFLGAGTEYTGKLSFSGTVRIDGAFSGEISSEGTLVLGKDASIRGQVRVERLACNGKIFGDVECRTKAVLQSQAVLEGSLRTPALVVEEGASIEGNVEMYKLSSRSLESSAAPMIETKTSSDEDEDSY